MEKAKKAESELKRVEESKAKKDAKKKELEEMIKKFEDATVATTMDRYKAETEMRSLSKKTFLVKKRKDLIKSK